tara:strand:+ start:3569 stop:4435 length:867 start_codon:yes stop_codon:yes gene_type:complete
MMATDTPYDPLREPLRDSTPFPIEAMRTLVEAEKDRRIEAEEPDMFDCEVIDADNPEEVQQFHETILSKMPNPGDDPLRFQGIVKNGAHYTAFDFELSGDNQSRYFMVDAAGAWNNQQFLKGLKNTGIDFKVDIAVANEKDGAINGIQTDIRSCAAMALDHACQLSWMTGTNDIYQTIDEKHDKNGCISWTDLPPELVWNAQSYTWLDNYVNKNPEKCNEPLPAIGQTMKEVLEENSGTIQIDKLMGSWTYKEDKKINQRAENSFKQFQDQAVYYLEHRVAQSQRPNF